MKLKIKKGDKVKVMAGKDKGRQGIVERVFPQKGQVLVAGVNLAKKHLKARRKGQPGGIIDLVKPLVVSKVALICPKCEKITRIGFRQENDQKIRICKKCHQAI